MADPKAATRQGIELFNQGKIGEWIKMLADDAELVSPMGGTLKGPEAIREFFEEMRKSFPDARVNIRQIVAEGNTVAVEYTYTGTNTGPSRLPTGETIPATNKTLNAPALDIGTYDDSGKLKSLHQYFDVANAMQQLGLVPAPAAARA